MSEIFQKSSFFFIILLFLISTSLNAQTHFSSLEADPAAIIENVNVISGDYSELEIDLNIAGPDPLVLARFYSSQKLDLLTDFGGWFLRPQRVFKIDQRNADSYFTDEGEFKLTHIYVGTPEGSILKFTGWQNVTNLKVGSTFFIEPEEEFLGIVNTARGTLSSWTNIKNYKIIFHPNENTYEFFFSNGRKHIFSFNQLSQTYQLQLEQLPWES